MEFKTESGSLLVIRLSDALFLCIAEIIQSDPLVAKVTESGNRSKLKVGDDFIIDERRTKMVQGTEEEMMALLIQSVEKGPRLFSGLKDLGVPDDGRVYQILPDLVEA